MAHEHPVIDKDTAYVIDPITRAVTNSGVKNTLMQFDNNSERYTFSCPQYIEGHNMADCNKVYVYFVNTCSKTRSKSKGKYEVTDLSQDGENITFSWLIPQKATKYAGPLAFHISFICEVNGINEYEWNTDVNADTIIRAGRQEIEEDINSLDISLVRGHSANFGVRLKDENGDALILGDGQELIFGVATASKPDEILLQKTISDSLGEGYYVLQLTPADTAEMSCGDYLYDVSLKYEDKFYPIIEASTFNLRQNITKYEDDAE